MKIIKLYHMVALSNRFCFACTIICLLSFNCSLYSQNTYQRTFGGKSKENAFCIIETADKGHITIGSTESFGVGKSDMYVIKLDSLGNLVWAKAYGGINNDYGRSIDKTKDGNYILVGHSVSFTQEYNDIFIVKIDPDGNVLWSKSYGLDKSDYSNSIKTTRDGGFVILGETINMLNHEKNSDILVIRLDSSGKFLWSRIYGGNSTDYAYSIEQTIDGGFIIGGETNSYGAGEWDFYLIKIKNDGTPDWSKTYGESKTDYGRYAVETPDGGYLIGGGTFNFKTSEMDLCIVKVDEKGGVEWAKTYGGSDTDYLLSLKMISDKRFAATGYTNSFGREVEDAFIMTFNLSGKSLGGRAFGSDLNDYGVYLTPTSDNGIILCGSTKGFGSSGDDIYIVKTSQKWKLEECNMNAMYPLAIFNVDMKDGSGIYDYELHCLEENIQVSSTDTVTAEQVLCIEN